MSSWSRNDTGFGLCQSFISPPPLPAGMMWGWDIFVCWKSVTCAFALWARVGLGLTRGRVVPLLTTDLAICQKRSNALKKVKNRERSLSRFAYFFLTVVSSFQRCFPWRRWSDAFKFLAGHSTFLCPHVPQQYQSMHWLRNCYFNLEGVPLRLIVTWEFFTCVTFHSRQILRFSLL